MQQLLGAEDKGDIISGLLVRLGAHGIRYDIQLFYYKYV